MPRLLGSSTNAKHKGPVCRVQFQLQALNINNAVFGFFTGTTAHDYAIQREYHGPTFYFGTKFKF